MANAPSPLTTARLRWSTLDGRRGELTLATAELTIGRATECDLVVDSALVSRVHCRIVRDAAGWAVEDAGSSNGTYVNGYQIRARRPLQPGDRIRLAVNPSALDAELVLDAVAVDPDEERRRLEAEIALARERTAQLQQALGAAQEQAADAARAAARGLDELREARVELAEAATRAADAVEAVATLEAMLASARAAAQGAERAHQEARGALQAAVDEHGHDLRKLAAERERLETSRAAERARADVAEANCASALAQVAALADENEHLRRLLETSRRP